MVWCSPTSSAGFAAPPKWQMFVAFWAVGVLRGLGYIVGALVGTRLHDARWSEARGRSRRSARVRWSSPGWSMAGRRHPGHQWRCAGAHRTSSPPSCHLLACGPCFRPSSAWPPSRHHDAGRAPPRGARRRCCSCAWPSTGGGAEQTWWMPVSELFPAGRPGPVFVVLALGRTPAAASPTGWAAAPGSAANAPAGAVCRSINRRLRRALGGRVGAPWCRSVSPPSASRARSTSAGCSACRNAASNRPSSSVPCSGPRSTRRSGSPSWEAWLGHVPWWWALVGGPWSCLSSSCPADHPSRRGVILPDRPSMEARSGAPATQRDTDHLSVCRSRASAC